MTASDLRGLTVEAARRLIAARFKTAGLESPELDARLLIGSALKLDHTGLAIQAARNLTAEDAAVIEAIAQRRLMHEPVARIVGRKEFWGLDLRLSKDTLVPRPDTETLVEVALQIIRRDFDSSVRIRIADLGTGTGAILFALLSECQLADGIGTDISDDALATAQANAQALGLATRAAFVRSDYAAALSGPFHLIVSNPPYIRSNDIGNLEADVRDHDPHPALDGGADGLDAYRAIAPQASALLAPGGALIVETGEGQTGDVGEIMRSAGLAVQGPPQADLGGIERVVTGRKTRT